MAALRTAALAPHPAKLRSLWRNHEPTVKPHRAGEHGREQGPALDRGAPGNVNSSLPLVRSRHGLHNTRCPAKVHGSQEGSMSKVWKKGRGKLGFLQPLPGR